MGEGDIVDACPEPEVSDLRFNVQDSESDLWWEYCRLLPSAGAGRTAISYWKRPAASSVWSGILSAQWLTAYNRRNISAQQGNGEKKMPVFNVIGTYKVTKTIDTAGNERVVADRVLVNKQGVVAVDATGAAFIAGAGFELGSLDKEVLSTVTFKVTQVS